MMNSAPLILCLPTLHRPPLPVQTQSDAAGDAHCQTQFHTPDAPPRAHNSSSQSLSQDCTPQDASLFPPHLAHLCTGRACFFWPGLPNAPQGYWQAQDLPFTPAQAAHCLEDIKVAGAAAMTGAPLAGLIAEAARPEALRRNEEAAALARFVADGPLRGATPTEGTNPAAATNAPDAANAAESSLPVLRRAAHIALLHAWLLEEQQQELATLQRDFAAHSRIFDATLGLEEDADTPHDLAAVRTPLPDSTPLTPPWRLVVENAAGCIIVCNDAAMAAEIREHFSLEKPDNALRAALKLPPETSGSETSDSDISGSGLSGFGMSSPDIRCDGVPSSGLPSGTSCGVVRAPLWRILGKSKAPTRSPWLCRDVQL